MIVERRNGDQVCLRHHGYVSETLKKLSSFRKEGILCDVTINVEDKKFLAHKNVLASGSQYFKVMFTGQMVEAGLKEITMESITAEVFEQILQFFYEGTFTIDMISVADTLHAASLLLLKEIENECFHYLKKNMNLKNCVRIKTIGEIYSNKELVRKSTEYIKKNFEKLIEEKEIKHLSLKDLKTLLCSDDLMCKSEDAVAMVIHKWLSVRPDTLIENLRILLKVVRIPYLTDDGFAYLHNAVKELDSKQTSSDFSKLLTNEQKLQNRSHRKNNLKCRKALAKENALFCVGRYGDCYCYSMKSNKFHKLESYPETKQPNDIVVHGQTIYAVGSSSTYSALSSYVLYSFDTKANKWTRLPSMTQARCLHCAVFFEGKLYVIGGKNYETSDTSLHQSVECFDPVSKIWSTKANTLEPRINACAVSTNKYVYVIGGESSVTNEHQGTSCVERYSPSKESWERAPSLNSRRTKSSAVFFNDKLYVFGGKNVAEVQSFEYLEPNGKKWVQVAFPFGMPIHSALTIDDKILALGSSFWGDDLVVQYSAQRRRGSWQKVNNFIHASHRNKSFKYVAIQVLNYDIENKPTASCDCNDGDGDSSVEDEYVTTSDNLDTDDDVLMEFAPWGLWV